MRKYIKTREMLFKIKKLLFGNTHQTPLRRPSSSTKHTV